MTIDIIGALVALFVGFLLGFIAGGWDRGDLRAADFLRAEGYQPRGPRTDLTEPPGPSPVRRPRTITVIDGGKK